MSLRLLEIFLPTEKAQSLTEKLQEFPSITVVQKESSEDLLHVKLLIPHAHTEALLDRLEAAFTAYESFRIIISSVEATIPRIEDTEKTEKPKVPISKKIRFARVSREELYSDIRESSRLSGLFVVMVALSAIVVAIGLLRNNTAVVIGAMVIAPLLGPNVALALSATLGDLQLAKDARRAIVVGIFLPLFFSAVVGFIFAPDQLPAEIISRTQVNLSDILLALAAGCVATLSFTMALSGTLIGVMVAVALLPPLVAAGILLGCAQWQSAVGAALIFATNLICVNLAGITTFLIQGVRPLWWYDKEPAQKATKQAMTIWILCLLLLIVLILISQKWAQ